jgi:rare lipoprotein A
VSDRPSTILRVLCLSAVIGLPGAFAADALADPSGGAGTAPAGGSASPGGRTPSPRAHAANRSVSASGHGITFSTLSSGVTGRGLTFIGTVAGAPAGKRVEIQRRGAATGWHWSNTAHATTTAQGDFQAHWPANRPGQYTIRAVAEGDTAHAAAASPTVTVTVFALYRATIYGPGFWGRLTACGERLERGTIGVASPTLPCGAKVALLYGGRTMDVPVIDRGPYSNDAQWDLTEATARALGMPGTETIGAATLTAR